MTRTFATSRAALLALIAALLFTAFGNTFWNVHLTQPMAALPLQIYQYAISPYDYWHQQAWAASLVLVVLVVFFSLLARLATRSTRIDRV